MTRDIEQRRRAVEDSGHSFIVEASAGTGKTSTLVNRILHLVLEKGPSGLPISLSRICAITFTEKAAGEMKLRLRQQFEEIAGKSSSEESRSRAREALLEVEIASISTFHSFAVALLKERPIEAGLDPHFTALDEIRSELFFRETWESWIGRCLSERTPLLERSLRAGIGLGALQNLAATLRKSGHAVRALDCDSPPSEAQLQERFAGMIQRGQAFLKRNLDAKDRLLDYLQASMTWLQDPGPDCPKLSKPGNAGSAKNWDGGKTTLESVQEYVREVVEFCDSYQKLPGQQLLSELLNWIRLEFIPEWEYRKRTGGLLDFDDQLWLARDLLLRSKAVRSEFQSRFATLLVDEFQDTDSIQWDIVRLLSSADLDETDPARIVPGPGRLFIVGDPKQSIYRFRSADIETYLEIAEPAAMLALGLERLELTTNFRSVPSILRFVDNVFSNVMQAPADGRYQPDYLPFGGEGHRKEELNAPSVHFLGEQAREGGYGNVREFAEHESSRMAALIGQIPGSPSWKVQEGKSGGWRTPRFGDIAILLPVLSRADALEDALRDREIPYVLEGGKFYYLRSEVSSAITILRALANPNDDVALYGSLRSIFFGLSDEDLLKARMEGVRLDYRASVPPASALAYPFEVLLDLHRNRHERRASETLEILLQRTGAREVLATRGFQSIANLNKLARTLRALQGDATFSQVVDLLNTMDEEGLAESESRLMEERSDAVRILSIHKSKGLDFPIVFVGGLGLEKRNSTKNLLADLHGKKVFALSLGSQKSGWQTPGWRSLVEEDRKREDAELIRLLYVALTRARDHMVISTHTKDWKLAPGGQWIPDTNSTRLKPLGPIIESHLSRNDGLVRWIDVHKLDISKKPRQSSFLTAAQDWKTILESEYQGLRSIIQNTPLTKNLQAAGHGDGLTEPTDRAADDRVPVATGSRAVRLGEAFHEAMESVDLLSSAISVDKLREFIARYSLDQKSAAGLEEMVRLTLGSDLLGRARISVQSGRRILRELPFVRPIDQGGVEEGKIDLLFEEKDGWVLVDYKTDWISAQKEEAEGYFRGKYDSQIREYVKAMQALPVNISSAYLLLARTGQSVRMV